MTVATPEMHTNSSASTTPRLSSSPEDEHAASEHVSDMIKDVEKEIRCYISEQRARDPLKLSPTPSRSGSPPLASSGPSPRASVDETNRRRRGHRRQGSNISLENIFDSPECRTQPHGTTGNSGCQLRRRGATFHRVHDHEDSDRIDRAESRPRSVSDTAIDMSSSTTTTTTTVTAGEMSPPTTFLAPPSPMDPRMMPPGLRPASPGMLQVGEGKNRSQTSLIAESVRAEWSRSQESLPWARASSPQIVYSDPRHGSLKVLEVQEVPLDDMGSDSDEEDEEEEVEELEGTSSREMLDQGNEEDYDDVESDLSDELASATKKRRTDKALWLTGGLSPSLAPVPEPARNPEITRRPSVDKRHRPSPMKGLSVVKSTTFPAKKTRRISLPTWQTGRKEMSNKSKPLHVKGRAIAGNFGQLITGKMFQRAEVDEMIDVETMRRRTLSPTPASIPEHRPSASSSSMSRRSSDESTVRSEPRESVEEIRGRDSKAKDADAPDIAGHPALRPQTPPPVYQASPAQTEETVVAQNSSTNSSPQQEVASAVAEDEVALATPPRIKTAQQSRALPTILEVSPLQDDDKEPVMFSPATFTTISSLTSTARPTSIGVNLPIPVTTARPLSSPGFIHGPIRLTPTSPNQADFSQGGAMGSGAPDLDWTAFQIAISGPTGDYLMDGGTYAPTEADEVADWFLTYGFESEGRMITASPELPMSPVTAVEEDVSSGSTPVELPGLEPASGRTSATSLASTVPDSDAVSDDTEATTPIQPLNSYKMRANLTDVGEFLSADMVQYAQDHADVY